MAGQLIDAIYEVVAMVPAGRALAYGDVAELLGAGGPRQVGAAMAASTGLELPWWRIVRADGSLPADLAARAEPYWRAEGQPLKATEPPRLRFPQARWQPDDAEFAALDAIAGSFARGHSAGAVGLTAGTDTEGSER
ncbi:MGMT family protein [Zhihengliuella halotolerans]|uniref:MGMT family protein n=1 Tax=Zhihengliuella halotolerans TaxID=370736 RepID=UPI000C7FA6DC|nr:MGMT family protein [Zhihengliuella halotolerans]